MRIRVIAMATTLLLTAVILPALPASAASSPCARIDRAPGWVARENLHKGTAKWHKDIARGYAGDGGVIHRIFFASRLIQHVPPVSGWFDRTSVTCGDRVGLHLSGHGKPITVELYRTGFYRGLGARLIWSGVTPPVPYRSNVNVSSDPAHTVSTSWPATISIEITSAFPPGQYLARLSDDGKATYAPLTIRDDQSTAPILAISSILTWQAYNHWGGASLYRGTNGSAATRSRIVSFDRPYDGDGSGQYLVHSYGVIRLAESLGLDLAYATDIDLNDNPEQVRRHISILFGGHSEYWTTRMRNAVELARATGVNIASLGANGGYWRTRLDNNGRSVVVWRDKSDPYLGNPAMRTNRWRDGVNSRPESLLFGAQYAGLGVKSDYKVLDANAWPFLGTRLVTNELIDGVVGKEVDSPDAGPGPAVQFLTSALVRIKHKSVRVGMTYYTTSQRAGVIDASTDGWVCAILDSCNWGHIPAKSSQAVAAVTTEILKAIAAGRLGIAHPATPNIPARSAVIVSGTANAGDEND